MHEILIDVKEVSGKAVPAVTSLQVAEVFEKQHKNVLQDIDRILSQVPEIFGRLNFEPSEYELKNNLGFPVRHPMYILTKDAFTLLTMGYTGEKAMRFKIAYIERFNEMERQLRGMTERREKEEAAFSRRVGRTLDDLSTIFKYAGLQGNQIALALDRMVKKETGVSPIESSGVMLVNPGNSQLLTPRAVTPAGIACGSRRMPGSKPGPPWSMWASGMAAELPSASSGGLPRSRQHLRNN